MKIGLYMATQWPAGADLGGEMANLIEQTRVAKANRVIFQMTLKVAGVQNHRPVLCRHGALHCPAVPAQGDCETVSVL